MANNAAQYTVKELATLANVTVRTLHVYDKMGLLTPAIRTDAGYRFYGEPELLKLQQILFYKELGMTLKEIADVLSDADFDLIRALDDHKQALLSRQTQIAEMLQTIDVTIQQLKGTKTMENYKDLYKGLTAEQAEAYHTEAIEKYGSEAVSTSETYLGKMSKEQLEELKLEQRNIMQALSALSKEEPGSPIVQQEIKNHFENIRMFWGTNNKADTQADAYKGLGELYANDLRFTEVDGKQDEHFATVMRDAMAIYADNNLL
ncbi:MAG: MerR family transcriptional regulator [Sphingobacteriales bacterium]|nr:MAG: MerR family transcriptional regulator [Sphingobacteriales bacterium]